MLRSYDKYRERKKNKKHPTVSLDVDNLSSEFELVCKNDASKANDGKRDEQVHCFFWNSNGIEWVM